MSSPTSPATGEGRFKNHKVRPPVPAYLPTAGSPLAVDTKLYNDIQQAPRKLIQEFTLPIRSGRAWSAPAGSVVKISTPEGPQVISMFGTSTILVNASGRPVLANSMPPTLPLDTVSGPVSLISDLSSLSFRTASLSTRPTKMASAVTTSSEHDVTHTSTLCSPGGQEYDFHCHSNLVRSIMPWGLGEMDVHDVLNIFQVTGLDEEGRYCMSECPAEKGDSLEFLAETDVLMALSTCPGGDLSAWGFGSDNEAEMIKCCRPLHVQIYELEDKELLGRRGWKPSEPAPYTGMHGMKPVEGEGREKMVSR